MNARQRYALTHPLSRADDIEQTRPLISSRIHATGVWLKSVLAVDR